MEPENLYSGTNTLTDNWLLQSVADLLSGRVDKSMDWGWVWSNSLGTYHGQIKAGAIQIDCLTSLLEQILFANNIYVMEEWIPIWYNRNTDLNMLYTKQGNSIIKGLSTKNFGTPEKLNIQKYKTRWLKDILHTPKLTEKYAEGMEKYKNGGEDFWSQTVNGVADYISYSTTFNLAYAPHAVRAGFLKATLWYTSTDQKYPSPGIRTFNSVIDNERIKLSEISGHDSVLVNLNTKIPSGALLCIQESSDTYSAIQIALQMRNQPEVRAVRTMLHELSLEISKRSEGKESIVFELISNLKNDIDLATEKLKMPGKNGSRPVSEQIMRQFNYTKYIDKGIIQSENTLRHSGILMNLLNTSGLDVRKMLEKKLKLDDHLIVKHLVDWNSPTFFKDSIEPQGLKEYKVLFEPNLSNNNEGTKTFKKLNVVILTAIKEEYLAVRKHLTTITDADKNDTTYEEGLFEYNSEEIATVIIRECGATNVNAAIETERAIQHFKPDVIFFVGIAGSRKPNDFGIGDVIFPEKVYSYEGGKSGKEFLARPDNTLMSYTLMELAKKERKKEDWKALVKRELLEDVKADMGVIASGEQVIENYYSEVGQILHKNYNDTSAVEMEGFGFGRAANRQGRDTGRMLIGVVRGISDILEKDAVEIGSTDRRPKGNKELASDTATAFTFWLILKTFQTHSNKE